MIGSWNDSYNMLTGMTWRRMLNSASIFTSYQRSRLTGKPKISGLPVSIAIEPTTSCNLRCPECPSGLRSFTRPTGILDQSLFRKVIDELAPTLSYLTFYFQGEPYLNPGFTSMVSYAAEKGIYTSTSTNAHFLRDQAARETVASGLDRLIISIDGSTQQTYEAYRIGGSLEKVLEGARNVVKWKKILRSRTPHVVFQFLVVRPNEHEIASVYRLAEETGVDQVVLKTAQIYEYESGSELIPTIDKYSRYRKNKEGRYELKNQLLNHCWKMWHSCVVTWDGRVVPCCFDKDAHFVLGDVSQQSFEEIWNSEKYNSFRASLLRSRKEIEICRNCTEGTKVWV